MPALRVIFAGAGDFGLPTLQAIAAARHELVQIISQPDRPAGRGRKMTPTTISRWAIDHSLPLLRTDNINQEVLPPADLMVVVAFGQKIADHHVHHPRLGSLNLHASRLPRYRGAAPINWTILRGETTTGNSVIRLAPKMDAGAILAQSLIPIAELETAGELHDRLASDGAPLMLRMLDELADGRTLEITQDESQATLAPKLSHESGILDWSRPADDLSRHIRGLYPWPGCRVTALDAGGTERARLILVRARPASGEGARWQPGEIMMDGAVAAGANTAIRILECQPEGKRVMSFEDFQRGHPWQPGMRLESVT